MGVKPKLVQLMNKLTYGKEIDEGIFIGKVGNVLVVDYAQSLSGQNPDFIFLRQLKEDFFESNLDKFPCVGEGISVFYNAPSQASHLFITTYRDKTTEIKIRFDKSYMLRNEETGEIFFDEANTKTYSVPTKIRDEYILTSRLAQIKPLF